MASILYRPPPFLTFRPPRPSFRCVKVHAVKEDAVYEGIYGSFSIDDNDKREVFLYRAGLSLCASSLALGTALSFFPDPPIALYNPLCVLGGIGFGLSLTQVHMYAGSIKRTVQFLWLIGVLGSLYIAATHSASLPESVVQSPEFVWAVGPFFAAMTGLAIKEGLCYGKLEAALLTFLIPSIMLGHLTQVIPGEVLHVGLGGFALLFGVLAGRKYTQPIKDDIGDKSVFTFNALPEEEQIKVLKDMEQAQTQ